VPPVFQYMYITYINYFIYIHFHVFGNRVGWDRGARKFIPRNSSLHITNLGGV
jgi:hypothetical protein